MINYPPLKYQIDGIAYGITGIVSLSSFLVNLHSILVYGITFVNLFLILGDASSLYLALSSHFLVTFDGNLFAILLSGLAYALQISMVINYPTQRSWKLLTNYL